MKKWLILILIYIVIALILSAITAIPKKVDGRDIEKHIQHRMYDTREATAEIFQNIPKEIIEEAEKGAVDSIRGLYEHKNSFSYRFTRNLESFGIGLLIVIVMIIIINFDKKYGRRRFW